MLVHWVREKSNMQRAQKRRRTCMTRCGSCSGLRAPRGGGRPGRAGSRPRRLRHRAADRRLRPQEASSRRDPTRLGRVLLLHCEYKTLVASSLTSSHRKACLSFNSSRACWTSYKAGPKVLIRTICNRTFSQQFDSNLLHRSWLTQSVFGENPTKLRRRKFQCAWTSSGWNFSHHVIVPEVVLSTEHQELILS